jgi:hypothetical protein
MKYRTDSFQITPPEYIDMNGWCIQQFAKDTWQFEYTFYGAGYFMFKNLNDLNWFTLRWK